MNELEVLIDAVNMCVTKTSNVELLPKDDMEGAVTRITDLLLSSSRSIPAMSCGIAIAYSPVLEKFVICRDKESRIADLPTFLEPKKVIMRDIVDVGQWAIRRTLIDLLKEADNSE